MRKPEDPKVVDLKARRRAAELQKQALKGARPAQKGFAITPVSAWAILLLVAVLLTLFSRFT